MPGLEGCHLQTPFDRVALVAPVLEGANAKVTPVIEGVIEVTSTCEVAVVIVAPTPGVVDVTVA